MGLVRSLTRLYTFYSPVKRGSYRLAAASLKVGGDLPDRLLIDTADGCRMVVDPSDEGYKFTYFLGEYEPAVTFCIKRSVRPGDICLDIGANAGWFTTLFMKLSGKKGEVHSFEPVPNTFNKLEENILLNTGLGNAFANRIALGDKSGEIEMVLEEGDPDGHASVATDTVAGPDGVKAQIVTLDSYLVEKGISHVDFVKADIEGSELSMLRGASRLFEQEIPPILEIEMALATSKRFGYRPDDLISFISSRGEYEFYEISEQGKRLKKIEGFDQKSIGANVLCVPEKTAIERKTLLGVR